MTLPSIKLLVDGLNRPQTLLALDDAQWDLLIRQGRAADVLARLAAHCEAADVLGQLPQRPRRHLVSAAILTDRQHRELRLEVRHIQEALARAKVPLVLLKGAAYVMAGLEASKGRMMTDVDILVPRSALPEVESALMMRGWVTAAKTPYDQRYYRTWMHELPPMQHFHRGTSIDVHHAIVPLTARARPNSDQLLAAAITLPSISTGASRALAGTVAVQCLAPADMLLHSAAHLFHEGELEQGFRGLIDLDALWREFSRDAGFADQLVARAVDMDLARPLFYSLRYCHLMLETPVPAAVFARLAVQPGASPSTWQLALMDFLFLRALRPFHATTSDAWTSLARFALYLRGHWLRMPPWLLAIHLTRKLFVRNKPDESESDTNNPQNNGTANIRTAKREV